MKSWPLPVLLGALVAGAWAWVALGARDEGSGPTVTQIVSASLALWSILAWRMHVWVMRRLAGASARSMIVWSLGEGAVVGALIGAGAYALAVAQDGTPIIDLFIVLTVFVWAVLAAGVFFGLAVVIALVVHPRSMEIGSISVD